MSNLPSVRSKDIYDTDQLKPIEFVHERFFNNISLAKGWRESIDGLLNYSLDVVLPVPEGDAPITLAYSPFVSIPHNADPTCHPSNFVFARTVDTNTVRIYAMEIPNPTAMLPVTITMKQINTSEGTTNGSYNPSSNSNLNIEKTTVQVKGTSFIVDIDEDGYTTKETKLEMEVSAYKGTEKIKATMGNIESVDLMFNLDGTPIDTVLADKATAADSNKVKVSYTNIAAGDRKDTVGIFITVPKGVYLKDRMAYFIFPISAIGNFFARSTVYTNRSDEVITTVSRYEINFPKLSRTTGNVYFANGVAIGPDGFEITAHEISTNNVRSDADGDLVILGKRDNAYAPITKIAINGATRILDPAIFNGYKDLKLEFYTSSTGKLVYEDTTGIIDKGRAVYIRPSLEYIVPTTNEEGQYVLPEVSVSLLSKIDNGVYEPFFGNITVKDSEGLTLVSKPNASSVSIPSKEYSSSSLPSSYQVEVSGANGEIAASKFISILKQGDAELPFFMDITPSTLVIPTTPEGDLGGNTYDFTAKMMKGAEDVSLDGDWVFRITTKDPDLKIVKKEGTKNVFTVEAFTGSAISKVVRVEAVLGSESYAREIVITKLKQSESVGNYTFVKWGVAKLDEKTGEPIIDEETGLPIIEFTIDEQGDLPPGEVIGDYYGVASTDVDKAPTDPSKYKWLSIRDGSTAGNQDTPTTAFYIDGDTIVQQRLSISDDPLLTPRILNYELITLGDVQPLTINWQILKAGEWENIHEVENTSVNLVMDASTGLFDFNNKLSIRAEVVTSETEDGLKTYYAYINTYLLYSDSPTYFARLKTNDPSSKVSHVFPVDHYGNTISGTEDSGSALELVADVYKGTGKLKYWNEPVNIIEGEEWEIANQPVNLIENGWDSFSPYGTEGKETRAPLEVFEEGYNRNYLLNSDVMVDFEEQDIIPTTLEEYLPTDGGRNLILGSEGDFILEPRNSGIESDNYNFYTILGTRMSRFEVGETYTLSGEVEITDGEFDAISVWEGYPGGSLKRVPLVNGKFNDTFELKSKEADRILIYAGLIGETRGNGMILRKLKLEAGDIPTGWTPAPEDFNNLKGKSYNLSRPLHNENILSLNGSFEEDDFIGLWLRNDKFLGFLDNQELTFDLGSRNLLLNSGVPVKNDNYALADYPLTVKPSQGETVTLTIKGNMGEGKMQFWIYNSGGATTLSSLHFNRDDFVDGVATKTGTWVVGDSTNSFLRIYAAQSTVTGVESEIEWIKLEKGSTPTPWTPAPEDFNDPEFVVVKTLSEKGVINNAKLEKGSTPTDWTPAWEDIPEEDKPVRAWDNMVVHFTPLGNGLTRIQTWGGNQSLKLAGKSLSNHGNTCSSAYIKNNKESSFNIRYHNQGGLGRIAGDTSDYYSFFNDNVGNPRFDIYANLKDDNLDFIASDPKIVRGLSPALTVIQEPYPADSIREGWVENLFALSRINNLAATSATKIGESSKYRGYTFPVKPGEEYTLSRSGEILSNRFRVIFTEEKPAHDVNAFGYINDDDNEKTFTVPENANYMLIYLSNNNEDITHSMRIKLERGSEKTFWTKAIEDCTPEELTSTNIQLYGGGENTYLRKKGIITEKDKDYSYAAQVRKTSDNDIIIGSDQDESEI